MCDKNLFTLIVVLVFACIRLATGLARIRVATWLACARALAFFGADLGFFTFFEEIHRDNRAHRNHDQCGDNTAHYRTDVRLFAGRRRRGVGRNRIAARVCRRNHIVGGDYHVLGLNYLNALLGALLLNAGGYVRNLQHVAVCRRRFALTVLLARPWGLLFASALGGSSLQLPPWVMAPIGLLGLALFMLGMKYGDKVEQAVFDRLKERKLGKTEKES